MESYLILDLVEDIIKEEWDQEFKKEYGIINMIPSGTYYGGGHPEYKIIFNNEGSKIRYMKEFDVDDL